MEEHSSYQESGAASLAHFTVPAVVILVHYGAAETTRGCLDSLALHEAIVPPVVIADHGPGRALLEQLQDHATCPTLQILRRENHGFGAGCNAAAAEAFTHGAQWVWFLNNDARLEAPILTRLLDLAQRSPLVGLWGTGQRDGDCRVGADQLPGWFPTPSFTTPSLADLPPGCRQLGARETLSGASILVSRAAWERLGPWPEWCFLYWEDVAWCLKAHAAGIPMVMTDLEVSHARNTTTGRHSPLTTYYGARNGLLLHTDLWPQRRWQRYRQALHLLQKRLFQGNWRMLGPTLQGILDARKGLRFKTR